MRSAGRRLLNVARLASLPERDGGGGVSARETVHLLLDNSKAGAGAQPCWTSRAGCFFSAALILSPSVFVRPTTWEACAIRISVQYGKQNDKNNHKVSSWVFAHSVCSYRCCAGTSIFEVPSIPLIVLGDWCDHFMIVCPPPAGCDR